MYVDTVLSSSPVEFFRLDSQPPGTSGNTFLPVALSSDIQSSLLVNSTGLTFPIAYSGNLFDKHTIEFLALPGESSFTAFAELVAPVVKSATGTSGQTRVVVDNTSIWPGYAVTGTNVPVGTVVVSKQIDDGGNMVVELSNPASGTISGSLTFTPQKASRVQISSGIITVAIVTYSDTEVFESVFSAALPSRGIIHVVAMMGQELQVYVNSNLVIKSPVTRAYSPICSYKCVGQSGSPYMSALAIYKGTQVDVSGHYQSVMSDSAPSSGDIIEFSSAQAQVINSLSLPSQLSWSDTSTSGLVVGDTVGINPYSGIKYQPGCTQKFTSSELDSTSGGVALDSFSDLYESWVAVTFNARFLDIQDSYNPIFVAKSSTATVSVIMSQYAADTLELRFEGVDGAYSSSINVSGYAGLFSNSFPITLVFGNTQTDLVVASDSTSIQHDPFMPDSVLVGSDGPTSSTSRISGIKVASDSEGFTTAAFLAGNSYDTLVVPLDRSLRYTQYGTMAFAFLCNQVTGESVDGSIHTGSVFWEPQGAPVAVTVNSQAVTNGLRPAPWASALPGESDINVRFTYDSEVGAPAYISSISCLVHDYELQQLSTRYEHIEITNPDSILPAHNRADALGGVIMSGGTCKYAPSTSSDNKIVDWSFGDLSQWTVPGSNKYVVTDTTISNGYGISFDISSTGVLSSGYMLVAPSKTHQLGLYIRSSSSVQVTPSIKWYNGGTLLSTSTGSVTTSYGPIPAFIGMSATSPSTATRAIVEFSFVPSTTTTVLLDTAIFSQASALPEVQDFSIDHMYQTFFMVVKKHPVAAATTQYLFHHTDGTSTAYIRFNSSGALEQSGTDSITVNGVSVSAGTQILNDVWNVISFSTSVPRFVTEQDYISFFSDQAGGNNGRFLAANIQMLREKLSTADQQELYQKYLGNNTMVASDSTAMSLDDSYLVLSKPWVTA